MAPMLCDIPCGRLLVTESAPMRALAEMEAERAEEEGASSTCSPTPLLRPVRQ